MILKIIKILFSYTKPPVEYTVDRLFDFYYGIHTTMRYKKRGQPSPYLVLRKLRAYLDITGDDVLMDLGSGTGRVLFFFARTRLRRVYGVELSQKAFREYCSNCQSFRYDMGKVAVRHKDLANAKFGDQTIFFLFNPCGIQTFKSIVSNIKDSLLANYRQITICYYNPIHGEYLDRISWLKKVHEIKFLYPRKEVHIYQNEEI